jgi:biotin carboxyl carrier protein
MPGAVLKIIAPAGTAVKEGDPIIVNEAMKMETPIAAPCDGTVAAINVKVGEHVQTEQIIALMG